MQYDSCFLFYNLFLILSIERNDIFARDIKHDPKSRVLKPMIEEDRAARITNQVAKRLKPRSRMQLLPDDQSNGSFHLTY